MQRRTDVMRKGRRLQRMICAILLIPTACEDSEDARALVHQMIDQKIEVAVNMWRIGTVYTEGGETKETRRVAMLVKTNEAKPQPIEDLLTAKRTYGTPCVASIILWHINRLYKEWIQHVMERMTHSVRAAILTPYASQF